MHFIRKMACCLLLVSLLAQQVYAQSAPTKAPHIRVVLMGTFHFDDTPDKGKISFDDLFSVKRQQELQQLTTQLAKLKPDKVFVENEPDRQRYWDSLFTLYRAKALDTTKLSNEIFQVGIRTAKKAGLSQVICVDHQQELPYSQLQAFDKRAEKDSAALKEMATYQLLSLPYPYPKKTQKLADNSLLNYYLYINSAAARAVDQADYFVYSPSYGYGKDYTGVSMITSWYDRNAKIFTNILRKANSADQLYIVLFGSSHMLPLRHYFQNHPYFEVVELSAVLKPN